MTTIHFTEVQLGEEPHQCETVFVAHWGEGSGWWNANNFLAHVISAALYKLAENPMGHPMELYEKAIVSLGADPQQVIWNYDENEEIALAAQDAAEREWRSILNTVAWSFWVVNVEDENGDDFDIRMNDNEAFRQEVEEGRLLFAQWFDHFWA